MASGDALIVIEDANVETHEFKVFTKDVPAQEQSPEVGQMRAIIKAWAPYLWPSWNPPSPLEPRELKAWMREHNYSCTGY